MAVDLCSDNSGGLVMSPRISFSHNLCQADVSNHQHQQQQQFHRSDSTLLESSCDFDFCISESFKDEESSTADELFSDGKLLPLQIREKLFTPRQKFHDHQSELPPLHPPPSRPSIAKAVVVDDDSKKESLKEILGMNSSESTTTTTTTEKSQSQSKSFWRFKRSASVGNGGNKRSLICSLPLLSRSNSTPNPKQTPSLSKDNSKNSQKTQSSKSPYHHHHPPSSSQKPPLKKNYGSYNNGVRISPVLNIPPPYISKGTASLFGLGSFFANGKDKNKKK